MTNGMATIALGDVFFLRCKNCNPPKNKFFFVAHVDPLRMFLINSERTPFQSIRQPHIDATPPILQAEHSGFLTHDSFLGCADLSFEYSLESLQKALESEPTIRAGKLHPNAMNAVLSALTVNRLIKKLHRAEMIPHWRLACGLSD